MTFLFVWSFALFMMGCDDEAKTPTMWPKYTKGQLVYILGDKPALVIDTPSIDNGMFKYTLATIDKDGARSEVCWHEFELSKYPDNAVSQTHRDTVTMEEIVKLVENNIRDQQMWVDASFHNTRIEMVELKQEAKDAIESGSTYGGEAVFNRLKRLDSVFNIDEENLSANLKAGKYPKQ